MSAAKRPKLTETEEEMKFVLKDTFTDVKNMKENEWKYGKKERHFSVPWQIKILPDNSRSTVAVALNCIKWYDVDEEWSIDTTIDIKSLTNDGEEVISKNIIFSKHNDFPTLIDGGAFEKYLVDGNLTVELHVKINKMSGILKPEMRSFDESMKKFSDVALVVKDQKFYVLKHYLALHSTFFESLLFGNHDEAKQSEVELKDIDPYYFQQFLEALYGETGIDENTVEEVLHLASLYGAKNVTYKCEKFLIRYSQFEQAEHFILAAKYKLNKLKKNTMKFIFSDDCIEDIIEEDNPPCLDSDVLKELLKKSISIHRKSEQSNAVQLKNSVAEEKKLVIKYTVCDVENMESDVWERGKFVRRYKAPWETFFKRNDSSSSIDMRLECRRYPNEPDWSIDTTIDIKILTKDGEKVLTRNKTFENHEFSIEESITEKSYKDYLVDGNLTVECHVTIHEMTGIEEPNFMNFDESIKKYSDVVLKVKERKFYVLKKYLTAHSTYFESLFFGNLDESKQSEIELKDIDPEDFQKFLEVLYGYPAIDNGNFMGILQLADMYDAKTVIRNCDKFLYRGSDLQFAEKFILATQYTLPMLKKLLSVYSLTDGRIEMILDEDDPPRVSSEVWKDLLRHSIDSHKK